MTLVLSAFAMSAHAALDLRANEQPLPVTRDPQAIAKIPPTRIWPACWPEALA